MILETPYRGEIYKETEENLRFAQLCAHDCLVRGEAPFASHLLYTQEGVLNDKIPEERALGINAGFAWKWVADQTVIYINRGISQGMHLGIRKTISLRQEFAYRILSGYQKLQTANIFTITGSSGAGKTTIIKRFMKKVPGARLVVSLTTRLQRPSDLPGEYEYNVALEEFERRKNEFLWIVSAHGNTYGTLRASVEEAVISSGPPHLMLLVPESVELLRSELSKFPDFEQKTTSFYLLSPMERELRRRLTERDGDSRQVQKRIDDCKKWDLAALESDTPYIFLTNYEPDVGIEKAVQQMLLFA